MQHFMKNFSQTLTYYISLYSVLKKLELGLIYPNKASSCFKGLSLFVKAEI